MTYEEHRDEQERARQDPNFEYSWALPRIRHAHNGGEIQPLTERRYLCDGYDAQTSTVYEFNGCFWHGCPSCFPHRTEPHARLCDLTMDDVYQTHREKVTALRQAGYNVKVQWECQWRSFLRQSPEAQAFLKAHPPHQPLDPRDAFYGGRTNAYQLYYQVQGDGEQIRYYDFKSLYPYVNKYCAYPLGHPVLISQPPLEDGLADWFGLARVTILPPPRLVPPGPPLPPSRQVTLSPLCCLRGAVERCPSASERCLSSYVRRTRLNRYVVHPRTETGPSQEVHTTSRRPSVSLSTPNDGSLPRLH